MEELHLLSFILEKGSSEQSEVCAQSEALRSSYPNTAINFQISFKVPLSVASAEQSFSTLKLIRNFLRLTTKQERLSALAVLLIKQEILSTTDNSSIIKMASARKVQNIAF